MENIVIKKINNNSKIDYLIFSTTVDSPLLQLDEITKKIYKNEKIQVVFDQLLQTGDNYNRFIKLEIDDKNNMDTLEIVRPNKSLRNVISQYLKDHLNILENSILLSEQKKLIASGKMI